MLKKLDKCGRVVLPKEYRKALRIKNNSELEIVLKADEISIKNPVINCVFCNATANLVKNGNLFVCRPCIERLNNTKNSDILFPTKID
jgi:AbrB family looped-hinge helix DNA binding protein